MTRKERLTLWASKLGEIEAKKLLAEMVDTAADYEEIIRNLIEAAGPFTDDDVVDRISTTDPLMERLENAIKSAEKSIA